MTIGRRALLSGSSALTLSGSSALTMFAAPATAQQSPPAPSGGREATLMPGKRSLRQRVLTRPGAAYRVTPGAPAGPTPASPLTPLFVYARQAGPDSKPWVEVGPASRGTTLGWLPEDQTIPWQHTMTAAFHNPAGRERTLFFRDRDSLLAMLGGATPPQEARQLTAAAQRTPRPADFPVVAMEPAVHIDIKRQFYLLPILQAESVSLQDGREYRMMEVASIPLSNEAPAQQAPFTVGIAFVVDTTLSMDPYINKARSALSEFVKATAAEPGAPTRYALMGFRNNLTRQPRLEYLHRIFAKFADSTDADGFIRKIQDIKAHRRQPVVQRGQLRRRRRGDRQARLGRHPGPCHHPGHRCRQPVRQ